jgi:hypothetical protein
MHETIKFKHMTTTISTSSKNYFNKIQKYLRSTSGRLQGKNNKRLFFTLSFNNEVYTLTIFDLPSSQTNSLIQKMTKHFHLSPKQPELLALAA